MSYDTNKAALLIEVNVPPPVARMSLRDAEAQRPGLYACDGVVMVPLWKDGGPDITHSRAVSFGPDGKALTDAEVFRVWTMLTTDLASRPGLNPMMRNLCSAVDALVSTSLARTPPPGTEPKKLEQAE